MLAKDVDEVSRQLGRSGKGIVDIACRCVCQRPLVVKSFTPGLDDGTLYSVSNSLLFDATRSHCGNFDPRSVGVHG